MRTSANKYIRALGEWLLAIGVILLVAIALFGLVWSIVPPWKVKELQGSVVSWGEQVMPNVVIRYYKMLLIVRTDDGRDIGVSSERRVPPKPGERIFIQERVGLLGTRSFVEIPAK